MGRIVRCVGVNCRKGPKNSIAVRRTPHEVTGSNASIDLIREAYATAVAVLSLEWTRTQAYHAANSPAPVRIAGMRYRLLTLLIVATVGPLLIASVALLVRPELGERPPPPLVPTAENDRHILKLANQFVSQRGATDYSVPIRIEPGSNKFGTFVVIYWTPRREIRMLGERAVIVDPRTHSVEFVMRD